LLVDLVKFLLDAAKGDFSPARNHLIEHSSMSVMTASQPFMIIILALVALIYGHDGRSEEAVELFGFAFSNPAAFFTWLREYAPIIDLQSELRESTE
jgi:hypothetical protein